MSTHYIYYTATVLWYNIVLVMLALNFYFASIYNTKAKVSRKFWTVLLLVFIGKSGEYKNNWIF